MLSLLKPVVCGLMAIACGSCLAQAAGHPVRILVQDQSGVSRQATCTVDRKPASETVVANAGICVFPDLSPGEYRLRVVSIGFKPTSLTIDVFANSPEPIPVTLRIPAVTTSVEVTGDDPQLAPTPHVTAADFQRAPIVQPARDVIDTVAQQPGWLLEAHGVLHPRGSEYDTQYIVDGVPILENRSPAFSPPVDSQQIDLMTVKTAGYPASVGRKLGGIIEIDTVDHAMPGWHGSAEFDTGSFDTHQVSAQTGIATSKQVLHLDFSGARTSRYLDPPTLENFHNSGSTLQGGVSFAHEFSDSKRLRLSLRHGTSDFGVPNELEQHTAGQRQQRSVGDTSFAASYEQVLSPNWIFDARGAARRLTASLRSNTASTPIAPNQDRSMSEFYGSASLGGHASGHDFGFGSDIVSTSLRENFSYNITDPTAFPDVQNPFSFSDQGRQWQAASWIQDRFSLSSLTISAGLRYDYYHLFATSHALSPRLSAAYNFKPAGLVFRASYDRIFDTPVTENLLLASAPSVRSFSSSALRIQVPPAHANFYEVGVSKHLGNRSLVDVAAFRRDFKNFYDDDVLLNTGISIPISFASATIEGIETTVRATLPHHILLRGSYSNLSGIANFPVTGGLFLDANAADLLNSTERFRITQDQRNTASASVTWLASHRLWFVTSATYGSGLPVELESGDTVTANPRILNQVNFARGRLRPSNSLNAAVGIALWKRDMKNVEAVLSSTNLTDRLNVINFAGLFSGTAIAPPRAVNARLRFAF